jgi:hypothetical protein
MALRSLALVFFKSHGLLSPPRPMFLLQTTGLFILTALAEIVGRFGNYSSLV